MTGAKGNAVSLWRIKKYPAKTRAATDISRTNTGNCKGDKYKQHTPTSFTSPAPRGSIDAALPPSPTGLTFPFSVHMSFFVTILKPSINATTITAIAHESPSDKNESCSQKSARELENSPPTSTAEEFTRRVNPATETLTTTNAIRVLSDIKRVFQSSTAMLASKRPAKTKRNSRKTMPATAITNEAPSISYCPEHSRRLISFIFQQCLIYFSLVFHFFLFPHKY